MESVKNILLTNWHLMRVIRLVAGIVIAFQAFNSKDFISGIIGAFLLFQAITNTGCCGTNGCALSNKNEKK